MLRYKRNLVLDVFDYAKHKLCTLYDNAVESSGQASNVLVTTERNGWKVLTFDLPTTCETEDGQQPNFRLDYMKADYMIRLLDDDGVDWYLISEPKVTHVNRSKNVSVIAGHISQLLKTKNMGLEFTDADGNNVGTAYDLLTEILNGTTWTPGDVYRFVEKDQYETYVENGVTKTRKKEKMRTLRASAKTGAFKLITQMCDLFDAKPVFHGDTRTVDIIPMNPFSVSTDGELPSIFLPDGHAGKEENRQGSKVIELHYGQNVSNVTRTMNTENIVTKLYAYGSWGDTATGYCGIDECIHKEYWLTDKGSNATTCSVFPNWTECKFTVKGDDGIATTYYFQFVRPYATSAKNTAAEVKDLGLMTGDYEGNTYIIQNPEAPSSQPQDNYLVWSTLDPASRSYVWDEINYLAYPVYREAKTDHAVDLGVYGTGDNEHKSNIKEARNEFSYLMDFDYYSSVDLLTDDMLQTIAQFQRGAPELLRRIAQASETYNTDLTELSGLIGSTLKYCRLPDGVYHKSGDYVAYTFDDPTFDQVNTFQVIPDSIVRKYAWYKEKKTTSAQVMGETVEYENKKSDLDWYHDLIHVAPSLKPDGTPQEPAASVVYILRDDSSWDKSYLKDIGHNDATQQTTITLWLKWEDVYSRNAHAVNNENNKYYLFEANSVNGYIGALESELEAACKGTKTGEDDGSTIDHRLYCSMYPPSLKNVIGPGFWGWWWKYNADGRPSKLYFCWGDTAKWGTEKDTNWYPVYIQPGNNTRPVPEADAYWYTPAYNELGLDTKAPVLYRKRGGGAFVKIEDETSQSAIIQYFGRVISACYTLEQTLKGQYQTYTYAPSSTLDAGNYAFETDYGRYWTFTLKEPVEAGNRLAYDTGGPYAGYIREQTYQSGEDAKWVDVDSYSVLTRDQDDVFYHPSNLMNVGDYMDQKLTSNGTLADNDLAYKRTSNIKLPPRHRDHKKYKYSYLGTETNIPAVTVFYYNSKGKFLKKEDIDANSKNKDLSIPANCSSLRLKQVDLKQKNIKIYEELNPQRIVQGKILVGSMAQPPVIIFDPHDNKITVKKGGLNDDTGAEEPAVQYLTSTMLTVADTQKYLITSSAFNVSSSSDETRIRIYKYSNVDSTSGTRVAIGNDGSFTPGSSYIRITCLKSLRDKITIRPVTTKNTITLSSKTGQNITYTILPKMTGEGVYKGLVPMMDQFADYAELVYLSDLPYLTRMQDQMKEMETNLALKLGDIFREGYWQKNDYVDEDEQKLYDDAVENIEYISKPETTYSVSYLDLYGANEDNEDYGASPETAKVLWPDIRIQDAIHLIDPEIAVNCWAYIDQLKKCYDQPWKTSITINTNLTLMNQHSFSDVISYIADVANQSRGRETMYERAKQFSRTGKIMAQLLEDTISTERNLITSVSSSWYTDDKGAQMFEATDGSSAMRLTGAGFAIADSKDEEGDWRWRTFGTGKGFTADLITAGHIRAVLIEAGTISLEKLTDDLQETYVSFGSLKQDYTNFKGDTNTTLRSHFNFGSNYLTVQQGTYEQATDTWKYTGVYAKFGADGIGFYGTDTSTTPDALLSQAGLAITKGSINLGNGSFIAASDGTITMNKGSITIKNNSGQDTFKVTNTGKLTATDAEVTGTIRANALYIGNTKANFSLNDKGKLTATAMADNTFVTPDGLTTKLTSYAKIEAIPTKISALTWDSLGNASGILLTPNKIKLSTTGQLEITSGNFTVDADGNVSFVSGLIGNWYIGNGLLSSENPKTLTTQGRVNLRANAKEPVQLYMGATDTGDFSPFVIYQNISTGSPWVAARLNLSIQGASASRSGSAMIFKMANMSGTLTDMLSLHLGGVTPIADQAVGAYAAVPNLMTTNLSAGKASIYEGMLYGGYASGTLSTKKDDKDVYAPAHIPVPYGRYLVITMVKATANSCSLWVVNINSESIYAHNISGTGSEITVSISMLQTTGQYGIDIINSASRKNWYTVFRIA